ncbi:hypothetical protein GCM10010531_28310 [Blastococcus jejuensis]|uniref:Uncharacterized protein n=1 Tax=Blastococcus jejuensis TaxID=351224 RepID=A0ABP6PAT6_9ACTN
MDAHRPDDGQDPAALLSEMEQLRVRTRRTGRTWWFPLTLFGVLVLGASPLYVSIGGEDTEWPGSTFAILVVRSFAGLLTAYPVETAFYWLAALAVGFVGSGLWYRRQAQRIGLRRPVLAFVLAGLLTTVVLVVLQQVPAVAWLLFWVSFRGTLAIIVIAVSLLVLAWLERSSALTAVVIAFLGVTALVSTYNVENLLFDVGVPYGQWANAAGVVLPGLVLLVSGLVARALTARPRDRVPA